MSELTGVYVLIDSLFVLRSTKVDISPGDAGPVYWVPVSCLFIVGVVVFNKIKQDCHYKQQVPNGKWTRKPLAYRDPNNFVVYVSPAHIIYLSIIFFKHIHTTNINTIVWQFVSFIYHHL